LLVKPVRQIVDDTKGKDEQAGTPYMKGEACLAPEGPEQVREKLRQQATHLGPVLEAILRESHGQSHWGLNE
jgi:hypothetical protein